MVAVQKQEMKDRLQQKRFYRSCLRKIQSFIDHEELSDELGGLLYACPVLKHWCQSTLNDWSDLIAEIDHLCVMAGISNDAKQSALKELGPRSFLVALGITLQKADSGAVRSPGGYMRGIVSKFRSGNLHLNRSLFGLMSARTKAMCPE